MKSRLMKLRSPTMVSTQKAIALGTLLRILLLVVGAWQDATSELPFTDVDHAVFSDAAALIVRHDSSPYGRATYRYSPLLAWLLLPTTRWPFFARLLFCAADLATFILTLVAATDIHQRRFSYLQLLNPFTAIISARGNAESLLSLLSMALLASFKCNRMHLAAAIFGLAVHFKIYPVVYAVPLTLHLLLQSSVADRRIHKYRFRRTIHFILVSFSTFLLFTAVSYYFYGFPFMQHTYLYHLVRKDHRHNFSLYFYDIYLALSRPAPLAPSASSLYMSMASLYSSMASFAPQLALVTIVGCAFYRDLPFAFFLQTFTFVSFNRVVTSQYFVWYLCYLPLILPRITASKGIVGSTLTLWIGAQALWLHYAYKLEFLLQDTFLQLFVSSCLFFVTNIWILVLTIHHYQTPV